MPTLRCGGGLSGTYPLRMPSSGTLPSRTTVFDPQRHPYDTGPQRTLVGQYVYMALHWTPLDERVLLWTGMATKTQRCQLYPLILSLSVSQSRSLLTGVSRSFARTTRTLWKLFRLHTHESLSSSASSRSPPDGTQLPALSPDFCTPARNATSSQEPWEAPSNPSLREEGDYG